MTIKHTLFLIIMTMHLSPSVAMDKKDKKVTHPAITVTAGILSHMIANGLSRVTNDRAYYTKQPKSYDPAYWRARTARAFSLLAFCKLGKDVYTMHQYDTQKRPLFTIDSDNTVTHPALTTTALLFSCATSKGLSNISLKRSDLYPIPISNKDFPEFRASRATNAVSIVILFKLAKDAYAITKQGAEY